MTEYNERLAQTETALLSEAAMRVLEANAVAEEKLYKIAAELTVAMRTAFDEARIFSDYDTSLCA